MEERGNAASDTYSQASHQALLKGPLEGSRIAAPVQQLGGCCLEISWIL